MLAVGTEADAVADGDVGEMDLQLRPVQAVELPFRLTGTLRHRTGPEAPLRIHSPIVEAHVGGVMAGSCDPFEVIRSGVVQGKSGLKGRDQALAVLNESKRAETLRNLVARERARLW